MKRAVLLTGHFPFQKRLPSMLWVSHHLRAARWHITHVTVGYSWLSKIFGDVRLTTLDGPPHHGIHHHVTNLTSIYSLPPIHPVKTNRAPINRLLELSFGSSPTTGAPSSARRYLVPILSYAKAARRSCSDHCWPNRPRRPPIFTASQMTSACSTARISSYAPSGITAISPASAPPVPISPPVSPTTRMSPLTRSASPTQK